MCFGLQADLLSLLTPGTTQLYIPAGNPSASSSFYTRVEQAAGERCCLNLVMIFFFCRTALSDWLLSSAEAPLWDKTAASRQSSFLMRSAKNI